jgi:hypothetical protein
MTRLGAILALCGALSTVMPAVSWLPVTAAILISAMFGWL